MNVSGYSRKWFCSFVSCGFVLLETAAGPGHRLIHPEEISRFYRRRRSHHRRRDTGPDLRTNTRDGSSLVTALLAEPDKMLAEGDPTAVELPNQFHGIAA
jgi:hypothetical protein